jgi:hypothetical protein
MSTEPLLISEAEAAQLLEGQPPLRLDVTVLEADAIIEQLRASGRIGLALLAERIRLQALPQAQEICQRVALLHAEPFKNEAPN